MEDYNYFEEKEKTEIEIEDDEIDEEIQIENKLTEKKLINRITLPVMTIYEKVRLLEERINQLDNNYSTLLDESILREKNLTSSMEIAIEEFNTKNFPPISIKRPLPNGNYEIWNLEDFEIIPE